MDEHKKLVMAERDELQKKIDVLYEFLGTVPYQASSEIEQDLLLQQYAVMKAYCSILAQQISRHTGGNNDKVQKKTRSN